MKNTKLRFAALIAAIALIASGVNLLAPATVSAQSALYTSCEADRLKAPLKLAASAAATQAATQAATNAATPAATAATNAAGDDIAFLSIVGSESQACYLTSETFLSGNFMCLPV